jgi:DNA-binding winged helix-turn-helix (wHTH) protein
MRLRFSDHVLDGATRELRRGGRLVPLSPQAFMLLVRLAESRPRAMSQAELRDALWPDTHVSRASLARVVCELRRALGDTARGGTIRTVPRYGYAFAAEASPVAERKPAEAVLVDGTLEIALPAGETLVGRGSECGVRFVSPQVSRVHARLSLSGRRVVLEDRGSRNGTWVNGARVAGPVELSDGDELMFGTYRVTFRATTPDAPTRSASA